MKISLVFGFVAFFALLGWRMSVLMNPSPKVARPSVEAPSGRKSSAIQEWMKNRDVEEKRNERQVRIIPDE